MLKCEIKHKSRIEMAIIYQRTAPHSSWGRESFFLGGGPYSPPSQTQNGTPEIFRGAGRSSEPFEFRPGPKNIIWMALNWKISRDFAARDERFFLTRKVWGEGEGEGNRNGTLETRGNIKILEWSSRD